MPFSCQYHFGRSDNCKIPRDDNKNGLWNKHSYYKIHCSRPTIRRHQSNHLRQNRLRLTCLKALKLEGQAHALVWVQKEGHRTVVMRGENDVITGASLEQRGQMPSLINAGHHHKLRITATYATLTYKAIGVHATSTYKTIGVHATLIYYQGTEHRRRQIIYA